MGGWMLAEGYRQENEALRLKIESLTNELAIYKKACSKDSVESLHEGTHELLTATEIFITGAIERYGKIDPCPAGKEAQEIMRPAWDAWGLLAGKVDSLTKERDEARDRLRERGEKVEL